ncbi:hypothetical protein VTO42DRAFT_5502 [Malbranchea cinnamomea]
MFMKPMYDASSHMQAIPHSGFRKKQRLTIRTRGIFSALTVILARGFWNLRINGKWYRTCGRNAQLTFFPGQQDILERIESLQRISLAPGEKWEPIPFPSPLHIVKC